MPITKTKNGKRGSRIVSTLMTIEDVQHMGTFLKELIESSHLKWWIIFQRIIEFRRNAKTVPEDERTSLENRIATYSNALDGK